MKKVKKIVAITESTKKDIVNFYGIPESQVSVNHNGYSLPNTNFSTDGSISKISKKFILYVARLEHPGKNHLNLLKAYEMLPSSITDEYDVVFPGQDWSGSQTLKDYHHNMKHKDNIHFLGFVSNEQLDWLYKNASLYVFPSFFEGFGLPLLEAMAYKVPIACSNIPPLVEVGQEAVITFNPDSHKDMSECISKLLIDAHLQEQLITTGQERLKCFSWQQHAKKLLNYAESK